MTVAVRHERPYDGLRRTADMEPDEAAGVGLVDSAHRDRGESLSKFVLTPFHLGWLTHPPVFGFATELVVSAF